MEADCGGDHGDEGDGVNVDVGVQDPQHFYCGVPCYVAQSTANHS